MLPIETYKYFGLLAIGVLMCGLLLLVTLWPQGIHKTFSQHAAASRYLVGYYAALFSVVLVLLNIFFIAWFVPVFKLPGAFIFFALSSSVLQLLCTLIPETRGWKVPTHRLLAGASALLLLPCMILLFNTKVGLVAVISFLMMFAIVITLAVMRSRLRYALLLQAVYFAAFFTPIILLSY